MTKMRMEVNSILMGGMDESDLYSAFDITDESLPKHICSLEFTDLSIEQYGRVTVENRLRPFAVSIQKSKNLNTKSVILEYGTDLKRKDKTTSVQIDTFISPKIFQKLDLSFDRGQKHIFFRIALEDDDHEDSSKKTVKLVFNFGTDNFNDKIRKQVALSKQ